MPLTSQVSGANASQSITITPSSGGSVKLFRMDFFTSAGTASLSITEAGTTVIRFPATIISTTYQTYEPTNVTQFAPGAAVVITAGAAGGGNTTTLNVHYELRAP